jgi:hypothetical protein
MKRMKPETFRAAFCEPPASRASGIRELQWLQYSRKIGDAKLRGCGWVHGELSGGLPPDAKIRLIGP